MSQRVLDRTLSPRPIDAEYIYMKIKAQILACADPLDFIMLNEKNMLDDFLTNIFVLRHYMRMREIS